MSGAPRERIFRRPRRGPLPLIGAIADSGQLTRLAVEAGVDFLLGLSASAYRQQGVSANAAFLPYRNSNDLMEAHLRDHLLPTASETPIVAGLLASDPTVPLTERLERLQAWNVAGVTNYPTVTLLDGTFQQIFEAEGCTVEAEVAMLQAARARGFGTLGFVSADPALTAQFARAGVDALVMTVGPTRDWDDVVERRDRLQQAIRRLNAGLQAARAVNPELPCLVFGGPITSPEELAQLLRQNSFDGFVGGSVFSRLPIESAVTSAIRRFKSVPVYREADREPGLGPILGASEPMRQLFRLIERAASADLNVCIEGASGVGKELVATQIHRMSSRSHGPLVTLNCGAIPESLLESELFGHEKGAFTGADHRRLGKFELADHGTLFLDEIGDLSPRGQVALLRAIQQREITRVGGDALISVDVRILSASNRSLADLVAEGRFRADLYYRLNNLTLVVPPLRQRLDDLPLLVKPILEALRIQMNRELTELSPRFYQKLERHSWSGNLRELQHVISQAALLEDGPVLEGRHFTPLAASPPTKNSLERQLSSAARDRRLERVRQALAEAEGNKSRAAAILGVSRKTLYAWMRELP